jgi:hypothetical protein
VRTAAAILAMVAATAGAARADDPPAAPITWVAPDGECPAPDAVIAEIEGLLGEVDWSAWPDLGASIVVSRGVATAGDGGWTVVVRTDDPAGERELSGATCAEVASAAALVVALTVDPDAIGAPEPPPDPTPAPAPRVPPSGPRVVSPAQPEPVGATRSAASGAGVDWSVRGDLVSDIGGLPGFVPGVGLAVAARIGAYRAELGGMYWFERFEPVDGRDGVGGDLSMWAGVVRGCRAVWTLDLCAGVEIGRLAGTGVGVDQARTDTGKWVAPVAGLGRRFQGSDLFGVYVGGELGAPLSRARFNVTPMGATEPVLVHQAAVVVGRVFVGVDVEFR